MTQLAALPIDGPSTLRSVAPPAWLPKDVWPFDVQSMDLDAGSVAVSEVGNGPTLVYYTGIGSFIWRDVVLRLSDRFRCVIVDPPGIGLSGRASRSATTLANSARALSAVVRALDLRDITLVVHDSAGPPALAGLSRMPERVRGIVGINTFGWKPSGPAFRGMLAVMGSSLMRRIDLSTGLLSWVTSTTFGVGRHLDARSRLAYREGLALSMGAFHDYLRDARFSDAIYDEATRALAGPFRSLPLLTIFGERNDPLGFQPQWKRLFPSAQQNVIPGGNHFPMCDDPDGVAAQMHAWYRNHQ